MVISAVSARHGDWEHWEVRAPLRRLLAAYRDLPRLDALDALNRLEVADFPHHDQQGRTATLRRQQQRAGFHQEDGAIYDGQGRRVSQGYDDFMAWLGSHNIVAAA